MNQKQKRVVQNVARYAEVEQRPPDFVLLWLTGTNTYLETIAENHSWLSHVPEETKANLQKVNKSISD